MRKRYNEISSGTKKMCAYIFNGYLPPDLKKDNEEEYLNLLINTLLNERDSSRITEFGDYNANMFKKCKFCCFIDRNLKSIFIGIHGI